MSRTPARKKVVITVPLSKNAALRPDEEISLRHLRHFLAPYDKVLVVPESLDISLPGFEVRRFDNRFFGSVGAYNSLMLSRRFYQAFQDYEFMLHYHLDALVFSDQLLRWCDAGLDYLAPPWINCPAAPWVREPTVGNGGFSLRRIHRFLEVLDSHRLAVDPEADWRHYCAQHPPLRRLAFYPRRFLRRHWLFNGVHTEIRAYLRVKQNEDMFWSDNAVKYNPAFRIASFEQALPFAFEVEPRKLFEMNNRQLPFGCHAFGRYDRAFWEPFLLA